jgi:hypothetical protein
MVDSTSEGGDDWQGDQGVGTVVGEVGEEKRGAQAEENQKASAKKRTVARIEDTGEHATASRVEGFDDECGGGSSCRPIYVFLLVRSKYDEGVFAS